MDTDPPFKNPPLINEAFEIVQWVILDAYIDEMTNQKLRFRSSSSSKIRAKIRKLRGFYGIEISDGTSAALIDLIGRIDALYPVEHFLDVTTRAELGIRDEETVWDFVYVSAIVFILLHEAGHYLAGHFNVLISFAAPEDSLAFSETDVGTTLPIQSAAKRLSLSASDLVKMMELEADGFAADLLFEDLFEVLQTFEDHEPRDPSSYSERCLQDVTRLTMLAMTIVIGLLERDRLQSTTKMPSLYPLPLARMLNVSGRRFRKLTRNTILPAKQDAAILVKVEDPQEFAEIAADVWWLTTVVDRALEAAVFNARENYEGPKELPELSLSPFVTDMQMYASGEQATTAAGLELSDIASKSSVFYRHMTAFRVCDFWT